MGSDRRLLEMGAAGIVGAIMAWIGGALGLGWRAYGVAILGLVLAGVTLGAAIRDARARARRWL